MKFGEGEKMAAYLVVFATLTLILTVLPGYLSYYQVPSAILAKVYSILMMVVLNSRMGISRNGGKLHDAYIYMCVLESSITSIYLASP